MKTMSNEKIKIGFVNYSLNIGGIENLILEICKRLNRNIFEPCIFVFEKDGKLKGEYTNSKVRVIEVQKNNGFDWSLPFRLAKILKKYNIDIVHTHNPSNWLYGGIAAKLANIPIIHTEHTTSDYSNRHIKRWELIEKFLVSFTNSITTVAESVKNHMVRKLKINPSKIKVIYNAIKVEDFDGDVNKSEIKKRLSLKDDVIVIGNVARFYENKDHQTLLDAFKLITERFNDICLLLVGDGPLKEKMQVLASNSRLDNKIKFLGNRRDIPELLKIMDIFVLSSKREGLPIVILEAMASRLPVVTTDVDGNAEVVVNGETGILVPPCDPKALADALWKLMIDSKKTRQMGDMGRERIEKYFTFDRMIHEYEAIYNSALRKKICIIGEFPPPPSGMGLQAELLVNRLREEGYLVNTIKRNVLFNGLFRYVNEAKILRSIIRFFAYVLNLILRIPKVRIVHIFSNSYLDFFLYTYPAVFVSMVLRKKVIIHYHGGSADDFLKKFSVVIKPVMKIADEVIVPSLFLKDIFGKYGIETKVIPNICDLKNFSFKARERFSPNFIMSRHLEKKYNIQCAIRAFHFVKQRYSLARFQILGGGIEEDRLKILTRELGISNSVDFLGRVDNSRMLLFYQESDIFLNSSNVDNMPIAVLEAFACGLPVVSVNSGGLKYLIEDRKTGFLVATNDHIEMAKRIFELLEHQDLAREIATNAREFVESFSWENIKSKWFEVYA